MKKFKKKVILPAPEEKITFFNIHDKTALDVVLHIMKIEGIELLTFLQHGSGKTSYLSLIPFLKNGRIKDVKFFMSDFIISMVKTTNEVINNIAKDFTNHKVKYFTNHLKIVLVKTKENYYCINSTSNFGSNSKIEQTEIYNNRDDYNFYANFAEEYFK